MSGSKQMQQTTVDFTFILTPLCKKKPFWFCDVRVVFDYNHPFRDAHHLPSVEHSFCPSPILNESALHALFRRSRVLAAYDR